MIPPLPPYWLDGAQVDVTVFYQMTLLLGQQWTKVKALLISRLPDLMSMSSRVSDVACNLDAWRVWFVGAKILHLCSFARLCQ